MGDAGQRPPNEAVLSKNCRVSAAKLQSASPFSTSPRPTSLDLLPALAFKLLPARPPSAARATNSSGEVPRFDSSPPVTFIFLSARLLPPTPRFANSKVFWRCTKCGNPASSCV
ncbi:unnamed protein product [Linum trigynum]|uniref:Uncharacterized protein n=1 Tax=Linum trigynum TaxID=586398 RepID=A0AAV2EJD3_9ROSI